MSLPDLDDRIRKLEETLASNTQRVTELEQSLVEHMFREEEQARELVVAIKNMLNKMDSVLGKVA